MPIDIDAIIERENTLMDLGGKPPFVQHVPQSDIDDLVEQYRGTPMAARFADPNGFMVLNTRIVAER